MASEVKTNKISPATSTTVTLGDASDLFQLPASAEIDIASGATLDVNGTIDLTGATTTGFPAGGLTDASQWRLTATITGDHIPITGTWEESDTYGYGRLGSAMSESSGVFTYPSTGFWLVVFCGSMDGEPGGSSQHQYRIDTTTNNSTYNTVASAFAEAQSTHRQSGTAFHLFDVTSTTDCKVRFSVDVLSGGTSNETLGSTTENLTYATFVKLADT